MDVEVSAADPFAVGADLVAVAAGPKALTLGAPERAVEDADPVAIVYTDGAPLAVVSGDSHTAAARAGRPRRGPTGGGGRGPRVPRHDGRVGALRGRAGRRTGRRRRHWRLRPSRPARRRALRHL